MRSGDETDSKTATVVLVQCTKSKRDGTHPARDLYDESSYFRKQRAYANAVADQWFIQSAEYALVHPDEEIESYNTHASDLSRPDAWAWNITDDLQRRVPQSATVEILGGAAYADPLTPCLEKRGFEVHEPLRGLGIGKRQQMLDALLSESLEQYA